MIKLNTDGLTHSKQRIKLKSCSSIDFMLDGYRAGNWKVLWIVRLERKETVNGFFL